MTNYEKLFGTPESTARTLLRSTPSCRSCAIRDYCKDVTNGEWCLIYEEQALLEWLKSEVRDD